MASLRGFRSVRLLCAAVGTLPSLLLLATLHPAAVSAQDSLLINCYRFDGAVSPNNTKCPNSNACCGPKATCLSNRLCANPGDAPNLWVRGPCAVKGWDGGCAQICKYKESGGIFPRVIPCSDGSLCCNNDPQCCQDGKGIFLDESGERVSARATGATTSYPPVSGSLVRFTQTPSTSTISSASSSSTNTVSSSSSTNRPADSVVPTASSPSTPPASSNSDDSIGLKVGLGLGIPLAVLITACVVYFVLRRRGRHTGDPAATPAQPDPATSHMYSSGTVYSGAPKPPEYPVELMGQSANELDGSPYGPRPRYELS